MQYLFETPAPTAVYVEIGSGDVEARAEDTNQTTVDVDGEYADEVTVEQRGDQIVVLAPRRKGGFFGTRDELRVRISLPTGSELATKLGSADVTAIGHLGTAKIRTGSGDVRLDAVGEEALIETGSGDIELGSIGGELRIKSGSGDIEIDRLGGAGSIATGSGDVQIGTANGAVQVRSGSGDLRIREAQNGVELNTASGDLYVDLAHRGRVTTKNVSGDINVGIPGGIPVWTDISTVTGSVSSSLASAGEPAAGQDYVELRAKTVSGDIHLEQR
jgi:DUF4097 and DUF4098 domain-containing protein YvlB